MSAAITVASKAGALPVLAALGLSPATYYRRLRPRQDVRPRRPTPTRALAAQETQAVLDVLHEPRFVDQSPMEVYATLLDEGTYLCSERTMYRILAAHDEVRERRNQLRHPRYAKPELVATGPNQVWTWDITKLKTHVKWVYLYLYVILDIYSRYAVGWMLAEHENAALAKRLVEETYDKQGVVPGQLILHADRGAPMRSKTLAQLLAVLDVERSHSRPYVSDDNPFSESQFKTTKYHPTFPGKFGGLDDGLAYCRTFFPWYNDEHHHSGLACLTPSDVHFGRAADLLRQRHEVRMAAFHAHPERFRHAPKPMTLPPAVWINPPKPVRQPEAGSEPAHMAGDPAAGRPLAPRLLSAAEVTPASVAH